jgi:polysaccharide pyruvyl transferase WcaK-like protein
VKTVLILGAEVRDRYTGNRGAEQLLRTASARLRSMGHRPAVTFGQVDPALVTELGLTQYVGNPRLTALDRWTPTAPGNRYVTIKSIDGVLDASGFALGDAWGMETAKWIGRKYEQWARAEIPIIALPQAYGTFRDDQLRATVSNALSLCSLVYPRDAESAAHLRKLDEDIKIGNTTPDITIAEAIDDVEAPRYPRMLIVPNWNLLRGASASAYLDSLASAVRYGRSRGLEPIGLLHEGLKDLEVLRQLSSIENIRIEASKTGWEIKRYIAQSTIVVSGRYHAVVAALSTNTPVLTHSWSHKYQEVLALFGTPSWLRGPDLADGMDDHLDQLISVDSAATLSAARNEAVIQIEAMWSAVEDLLSKGP